MAKRYGRNQKRRHRERIAGLEGALLELGALAHWHAERADKLDQRIIAWADRIRRVLGDEHPINERIKQRLVKALPRDLRIQPPLKLERLLAVHEPVPATAAATYIDLVKMELEIHREPPANVGRAVLELSTPEGRSALFIDRAYVKELKRNDPRIHDWVAREVAQRLAQFEAETA